MKTAQPDYILLFAAIILIAFGLIMITSASVIISYEKFHNSYYFLQRQGLNLLIGLALGYLAFKIPYKNWSRLSLPLFLLNIGLILLAFIPYFSLGETKRWLNLGPISFQPSEFLKLTLILYLASWWAGNGKNKIKNFSEGFLPFLMTVGILGLIIIKQPDAGTAGVILLISLSLYFLAGGSLKYISLMIAGSIAAFIAVLKTASYRMNRWISFVNPELDPQGIGYQINQAALALGSGGLFGLGLGQSRQKYNFLPAPITDSIVAIIGEELGYFGLIFLITLLLVIIIRGFKICRRAPDDFGKLLAGGIIFLIAFQTIIHLMSISGLSPLTGVPMPFVSYGGSALIVNLIGIGILLNISKNIKNTK